MATTGICVECKKEKDNIVLPDGRCAACRFREKNKQWRLEQSQKIGGCVQCKQPKPIAAKGLCTTCYAAEWKSKKPERKREIHRNWYFGDYERIIVLRRKSNRAYRERQRARRAEVKHLQDRLTGIKAAADASRERKKAEEAARLALIAADREAEEAIQDYFEQQDRRVWDAAVRDALARRVQREGELRRRAAKVVAGTCAMRGCKGALEEETGLCRPHYMEWHRTCREQNPYYSGSFRVSLCEVDRDRHREAMDLMLLELMIEGEDEDANVTLASMAT